MQLKNKTKQRKQPNETFKVLMFYLSSGIQTFHKKKWKINKILRYFSPHLQLNNGTV